MATATTSTPSFGSDALTNGVRVQATPSYIRESSDPASSRFLFAYHIVLINEGDARVTLRRRHWKIVDADGDAHKVEGEGVVGEQPSLAPGERFEYHSSAQLETDWGTMEGAFTFEREDHSLFDATVARFFLVAAEPKRRK